MDLRSLVDHWGTTAAERARSYPCDDHFGGGEQAALYRGISIAARPAVVYRWLCQMRIAPYSYDWIDNLGRRSPRTLTRGLERLAVGQPVMLIFRVRSFRKDEHLTLKLSRRRPFQRVGALYVSYVVEPEGSNGTRLLVKLAASPPRGVALKLLWRALAWGDLVMMRKQLLTFKQLAEQSSADEDR